MDAHSGVDELFNPDAAAKMPLRLLMKLDAILTSRRHTGLRQSTGKLQHPVVATEYLQHLVVTSEHLQHPVVTSKQLQHPALT